jgi:hypothetical protein
MNGSIYGNGLPLVAAAIIDGPVTNAKQRRLLWVIS